MKLNVMAIVILMVCMTTSCLNMVLPDPSVSVNRVPRKFPEVEVLTMDGESIVGKLAGFESSNNVFLLPAPYWGVEKRSVPIQDIKRLRNLSRRSKVLSYTLGGAAVTGIIHCVTVLETSTYKEDYQEGLRWTPIACMSGVLYGSLAGLIANSMNPKEYDFASYGNNKKASVLKHLMGFKGG
jgi:small nuclear ribonucleoprotein (snRNP)-like protein